jgi:hypothetical protein
MKKLNRTSSANLRVVSDDQLEQVVGGWGGHSHEGHGGHQSGGHLSNSHQSQGGGHLSNGRQSSSGRSNGNVNVNVFFIQVFNTTNNIGNTSTTNFNS